MATSQSHTLGEFIGNFFENLMKKPIKEFSDSNGLYFDSYGPRKCRKGEKVTWTDIHGNNHDLDFVIEKNGSDICIGEPIAFIELAWRRYTKHSKNKAQEISGAVNPICEKYKLIKPFKGAILSGQFTESSISQLKNEGFHVLYIPFEYIVHAFKKNGLDIEYNETTKEADLKKKYAAVSKESNKQILELVREDLLKSCDTAIQQFTNELYASFKRKIKSICLLPLHGVKTEVINIDQAISFISEYSGLPINSKLEYIEVIIKYNNNSIIQCQFKEKEEVIDFLNHIR